MGGGVIRTAAKAASFGAFRSPLIDKASRRASRHQVSALSSEPAIISLCSDKELPEASAVAPRSARNFDDWELAGGREEEKFVSENPAPRIVFGPAPTLVEAEEATSDLKEALEKVYFQPNLTLNSLEGYQMPVSCESSTVSTIPKHVAQMFSLLQQGTEAQVVVASLASDKSVWDAVMSNEKVVEFCKKTPPSPESIAAYELPEEPSPSLESKESSQGSMFADIVNAFKAKVSEMVSNISVFLQDVLGILPGKSNSKSAESFPDMPLGATFVALAVATIMVVLLKRG